MKIYKKKHTNKVALDNHIKKIDSKGGNYVVIGKELIYSFEVGMLQQQLRDKELVRLSFLSNKELYKELGKKSKLQLIDLAEDLMLDFEEYDDIGSRIHEAYN